KFPTGARGGSSCLASVPPKTDSERPPMIKPISIRFDLGGGRSVPHAGLGRPWGSFLSISRMGSTKSLMSRFLELIAVLSCQHRPCPSVDPDTNRRRGRDSREHFVATPCRSVVSAATDLRPITYACPVGLHYSRLFSVAAAADRDQCGTTSGFAARLGGSINPPASPRVEDHRGPATLGPDLRLPLLLATRPARTS